MKVFLPLIFFCGCVHSWHPQGEQFKNFFSQPRTYEEVVLLLGVPQLRDHSYLPTDTFLCTWARSEGVVGVSGNVGFGANVGHFKDYVWRLTVIFSKSSGRVLSWRFISPYE